MKKRKTKSAAPKRKFKVVAKGAGKNRRVAVEAQKPERPADWLTGKASKDEIAQPRRLASQIKVGKRFRKDYGDIAALAADFNVRGMIQPVVVDRDDKLIAGERRLKAWEHPDHVRRGTPLPVIVIPLDDIVSGEWAENSPDLRRPFTPSEAVQIRRAIEAKLKPLAKERMAEAGRTKRTPKGETGEAAERASAFTGKSRRTLDKAEQIEEAAERDPERFGKLRDDMNKSGRVDGPFRRLQVMLDADKLRDAPAPLPGNGPYHAGIIDFPWAAEPDDNDRGARGYYPYVTMTTEEGVAWCKENLAPLLQPDCVVGWWITNYHLARGDHLPMLEALGLNPVTVLTGVKDKIGRGQVARGTTEHVVLSRRGKTTIQTFPRTDFTFKVDSKNHSRKDQSLFSQFEKHVPAPRYFSLFETVDRGEKWDCHGDKMPAAPAIDFLAYQHPCLAVACPECQAKIGTWCKRPSGHKAMELHAGRKAAGDAAWEAAGKPPIDDLALLEAAAAGQLAGNNPRLDQLAEQKLIAGKNVRRLTRAGQARLETMREERREAEELAALPADVDELIRQYALALENRNNAVLAADRAGVAEWSRRLELLQMKANGGELLGMAVDDSPAERLRHETAARIGQPPMWGQRAIFELDIDGVVYIVQHDDDLGIDVYAAALDKPFCSETGFQNLDPSVDLSGEEPLEDEESPLGKSVAAYATLLIREAIANERDWKSGRLKPRKKPLPLPETAYRLPNDWNEGDEPVELKGRLNAAGRKAALAAQERATQQKARMTKDHGRLRKRGEALGHTISITVDCSVPDASVERGACSCGSWNCGLPINEDTERLMAAGIEEHLRAVIAADAGVRAEAEKKTARRGSRAARREPELEAAE